MATSQLRDQVQLSLGAAYTIERELGGGGMSRVFVAEENALGRKVVIKVLSPELAEGLSADRFAREIRLAARLQHPHIVPLFSAGTIDGLPYYTMPFVEGESLRARLVRDRHMPVPESLHLLRDTARALEYAHGHDVVHRDIKPDNILITGNSACVIDFGIAKAISAARSRAAPVTIDGRATQAGFVVGTPGYMAPEQATAEAAVDHRVDIYAFGCVAYELLTGTALFVKSTPREMLIAHLAETPSSAPLRRIDMPRPLVDLVMSCLAKAPGDRPQSAAELLSHIHASGSRSAISSSMTESPASIAVLPFENMSGDPENEYFADGMTEEIINALTHLEGLRVAGRTSSFAFKGVRPDLSTIGERLNVSTILEGSVRKSGSRLRITVQLVKVSDGYHLWSERYDRELTDVFAVQDEIANAVALKLRLSIDQHGAITRPRTTNIEAYEEFLKGRSYVYRLGHHFFKAIEHFQNAIAIDEQFGLAHAALAEALVLAAYYGIVPPLDVIDRAQSAAATAVRLDPGNAEVRAAMGLWLSLYGSDPVMGMAEWQRAMSAGTPDNKITCNYAVFGLCLLAKEYETAVDIVEQSVRDDPLNGFAHSMLALVKMLAGREDGVVADAKRGVEFDPELFWCQWTLQRAYHYAGMNHEALAKGAYTLATSGRHPWALCELAVAYVATGNHDAADAIYVELTARARLEPIQPTPMALAATCAGRLDDAIALCHRAVEERDAHIRWAADGRWKGWKPLYSHPGWETTRQRIANW